MCHEKYHHDAELRAIANRLTGLPLAANPDQRTRAEKAAKLLLDQSTVFGLLDYVRSQGDIPSGEKVRLRTKLLAVSQRVMADAHELLAQRYNQEDSDDAPF